MKECHLIFDDAAYTQTSPKIWLKTVISLARKQPSTF